MTSRGTTQPRIEQVVLQQAAEALRVLAHPHRLRMVELLLEKRHTVGELADELQLAPNAVSQHLSQMRLHGLLDVEREGRAAYYHVINRNAEHLIDCIRRHGCGLT